MSEGRDREEVYLRGQRSAYRQLLSLALRELHSDDFTLERMIAERCDIVARLRMICEQHGDNDWDDNLHLADVLDKHLGVYLDEQGKGD